MVKNLTRLILFLAFTALIHTSFGCGGGGASDRLSGKWAAESPNINGETIILDFDSKSKGISIQAVRALGDTVAVDEGSYAVSGSQVDFALPVLGGMSLAFTIEGETEQEKLLLGEDVYFRISSEGAPLSGQIRITQVTADELVEVSSYVPPHVPGQILVKEDGWRAVRLDIPQAQALTIQSGGLSTRVNNLRQRGKLVREAEDQALDICDDEGKECTYNVLLKTQSLPDDSGLDLQWNLNLLNMDPVFDYQQDNPDGTNDIDEDTVYVAVIDTGIRKEHREFINKFVWNENADAIWGADFVTHQMTDPMGNVIPAEDREGNFVSTGFSLDNDGDDTDPTDPGDRRNMKVSGSDSSWHGTHLAGIIAAATDNARGVASIAGLNRKVKILPVRAMGLEGNGTINDIAEAIRWACLLDNRLECPGVDANGYKVRDSNNCGGETDSRVDPDYPRNNRPRADIINLSLGLAMNADKAAPITDAIHECLNAYDDKVLFVAAAGNDAITDGFCEDEDTLRFYPNEDCKFYPAADPSVLSVGAVTGSGAFATSYSNYGDQQFLVAPGGSGDQCVLSLVNPNTANGYWDLCGTSQSAAHVSGVAAMMKAYARANDIEMPLSDNSTRRGLVQILQDSAIYLGSSAEGWDPEYGFGLVNPWGALRKLLDVDLSSEDPRLTTSVNALHFGDMGENASIILFNSGGGSLSLDSHDVEVSEDVEWITVAPKQLNQVTAPYALVVTVNRDELEEEREYTAIIRVTTNGGTKDIEVTMTYDPSASGGDDEIGELINAATSFLSGSGDFQNTEDIGDIFVYAFDVNDPTKLFRTRTNLNANYFFYLNLPTGDYNVVAVLGDKETDCSGDDELLCLGFPTLTNLQTIHCEGTCDVPSLVMHYQ